MPIEQLTYWFSRLTLNSPFLFAVLDNDHRYLWASQRYCEISGLEQTELTGKHDKEILGSAFYDALKPHYERAISGESSEGEVVLNDGIHDSSFHFSVSPFENHQHGEWPSELIIFHAADTSERQVLTSALESSESRFDSLCKLIGDGCCVLDNGIVMSANPQAVSMLGFNDPNEILGEDIEKLLASPKPGKHLLELIALLKPGQQLTCLPVHTEHENASVNLSYSPISLLGGKGGMLTMTKAGVALEHKQTIEKLAQFDALTGLYNRHGFSRRLEQLIAANTPLVMFYLDVDNFKNINDSLGHHIGDRVLQDIAQRLRRQLPSETILGHLGGDEFAVLLPEQSSEEVAEELAKRIVDVISQPFDLYHFSKFLACSIGLVKFPGDGKDARSLLQNADTAMYEAKEQGRNRVVSYSQHMNKEARMRLWLEIELQKALQNNGLEVWYQPKVNAKDHTINGAEALVRWKHPVEGYISPARFIPVAERSGMIELLGRNVMREVFQAVRRWQSMKVLPGRVAINLSPQQFRNPNLTSHMKKLQVATQTDPSLITFELTESAVMNDGEHAIQMLNAIKDLGFALSIDDFGTGYSSLSYLAKFPLDELKIDRAFIMDMETVPKQVTLIENIINLGRSLNMSVVAEGVESGKQASVLANLKCDTIQGFHFYKPMPRAEFEALLVGHYKARKAAS
ncbi:EAL domain-containing protein [Enterovibrio sp. ZSDZ35]|uniref:EAL domain-containing protein n=1 Tax=Enterovibrio qingdaonensis TaxID=2899818 RepID=A0ABT5QSF5_9GAMM|nr:EAL domain-containing protein [Enterovibrio sp. ZSDZ35]MDD1783920.1 EAL domain-containing protein [Enterovibrio sp. ZSDZ35]